MYNNIWWWGCTDNNTPVWLIRTEFCRLIDHLSSFLWENWSYVVQYLLFFMKRIVHTRCAGSHRERCCSALGGVIEYDSKDGTKNLYHGFYHRKGWLLVVVLPQVFNKMPRKYNMHQKKEVVFIMHVFTTESILRNDHMDMVGRKSSQKNALNVVTTRLHRLSHHSTTRLQLFVIVSFPIVSTSSPF